MKTKILIALLLLPLFTSFYMPDYISFRAGYVCALAILFVSAHIWKYSKTMALFVAYFVGNHLYISHFAKRYYVNGKINPAMVMKSEKYLIIVLCLLLISLVLTKKNIDTIFKIVAAMLPMLLLWQLSFYLFHSKFPHYANSSVAMTSYSIMLAASWNYYNKNMKILCFALFSAYFLLDKSIIGFFAFVSSLMFLRAIKKDHFWSKLAVFGAIATCVVIHLYNPQIFSLNGREFVWQHTISLFDNMNSYVFGVGGSTYSHFMPLYQLINKLEWTGGYFSNTHNDFLQLFFEHGAVGMLLLCAMLVDILYKTHKSSRQFLLFFFVLCVNMFGNFPLQVPSDLFMVFLAFTYIIKQNKERQHDCRIS